MRLRPTTLIIAAETSSPNPDTGRLVCLGYTQLSRERGPVKIILGGDNEKTTIQKVRELMNECHVYITWGGVRSLVPFLTAKMLIHGIDPSPLYSSKHIDLADLVSSHLNLSGSSLYDACKIFRVPVAPLLRGAGPQRARVEVSNNSRRKGSGGAAKCRAEVVALEGLTRRLLPLISTVYRDLPTLL
ncbi:MAG: hypothetical protein RMJ28_03480 [Nitrososphaerota archaeon]|nr:hypothetical protein [Candidatus Calditenuaceae archaeon]MDW8073282.1 hypothetical protein [Nitrososphaerota archaeon]